MVSLNAPNLLAKIKLIRPRSSSPRMEVVVVAGVDAVVEEALQYEAVEMVVIEPPPRQVEG